MISKASKSILVISLIIGIWFVISELMIFSSLIFASPIEVFAELFSLFYTGSILNDLSFTLMRTVAGLIIGIMIGIPLGLVMGYSKRIYDSLEFLVEFLRSIPVVALIPVFMLFLGIGDVSKIGMVAFITALLVVINTMYGVRNSNKARIMIGKTLNLNQATIFRKIIFPESIPYISVGMRLAISLSLVMVIVSEMIIGTSVGLGKRILDSYLVFNIGEMYAVIILTGIIGYLLNKIYLIFEKRKLHWVER